MKTTDRQIITLKNYIREKIKFYDAEKEKTVTETEKLNFSAKLEVLAEIFVEIDKIAVKEDDILTYELYCSQNNLQEDDNTKKQYNNFIWVSGLKKIIKDLIDNDNFIAALQTIIRLQKALKVIK